MSISYEKFKPADFKQNSRAPLTIEWKNTRMIRNHSIRACVREILNVNRGIDVVKINLIGTPSTGKTTLAKTLGHLIHTLSDVPYIVKMFNREDLMDMENTIKKLQPINHVLIFDDVSWLSAGNNKQKLDQIQKTFTEIRHLEGGQDIKVIIIFNFHYNLSIPKHLRQADFFIYTSIGSSELENTQKLVGNKNTAKLLDFRRVYQESISTGSAATPTNSEVPATFSFRLMGRGNNKFTYTWRKPFAPALFWNNDSLRPIIFPAREWIDKICHVCSEVTEKSEEAQKDVKRFKSEGSTLFGKGTFKQAIRIKFMIQGIYTYPKHVRQAMIWIEKYMSHKAFNYEDLLTEFNFSTGQVKCRKKLPEDISKL